MNRHPFTLSERSLTVYVNGKTYQTDRTNPNWNEVRNLVTQDDVNTDRLIHLMQPAKFVAASLEQHDQFTVEGANVYFNGESVHSTLSQRIIDVLNQGLPVDAWVNFTENVFANPFTAAREELYDFLTAANLPITPDGHFIAYKMVNQNYTDCWTGQIDNSVGQEVELPGGRGGVDPDRTNTCSTGLHFCSEGYLESAYGAWYKRGSDGNGGGGGGTGLRCMLVKVNPADVVSIPNDYKFTKGRTWRYEVVGEIKRDELIEHTWTPVADRFKTYAWENERESISV